MMIRTTITLLSLLSSSLAGGVGTAWDVSPSRSTISEETTVPAFPKLGLSAFEVRSISGIGHLATRDLPRLVQSISRLSTDRDVNDPIENDRKNPENMDSTGLAYLERPSTQNDFRLATKNVEILPEAWEKFQRAGRTGRAGGFCLETSESLENTPKYRQRVRRSTEETQMEKISASKSVREPRLGSPESWSTQPLSVEFRHRKSTDGLSQDVDESSRSILRGHQAPQVDFVTTNRRNFDARESRDLPIDRYQDDGYYRNSNNYRNYDISPSRGYFYPDHFRTERDYFVRGPNDPVAPDRYRIDDYDMYRNRPTPKPKRIIYYATLPEIVRKPVDLRTYPRPYDNIGRTSGSAAMNRDGPYKRVPPVDSSYRYKHYAYGGYNANYDDYIRRPSYQDRFYSPYDRLEEDRYREQDLDHASFKQASRSDDTAGSDAGVETLSARPETEKTPWPIHVGTEINIKDNQRVSGRKIYGQQEFDRFRLKRVDHEENREMPEGSHEERI